MCRLSCSLGASTSWNPQGLSRPVMGLLYLYVQQNKLSFLAFNHFGCTNSVCHVATANNLVRWRRVKPTSCQYRSTEILKVTTRLEKSRLTWVSRCCKKLALWRLRSRRLRMLLVEALRYTSEGRGFDCRRCHWNFSLTILLSALWSWGRLSL